MTAPHIGTLGEQHLHAALKRWLQESGDRVEVPLDGFVIDLVRGDTLIEVQTRGFASMRRKFDTLLDHHAIRLVHPIAATKWIRKVDADGAEVSRRRSPKRGIVADVCADERESQRESDCESDGCSDDAWSDSGWGEFFSDRGADDG